MASLLLTIWPVVGPAVAWLAWRRGHHLLAIFLMSISAALGLGTCALIFIAFSQPEI